VKILSLSYEFPPLGGGGAKVVDGLTRALASAGHETHVVTMGFRSLPAAESRAGVRVHRQRGVRMRQNVCSAPEMLPYVAAAGVAAARLARSGDYAVNHTHFIYPDGIVAYALRRAMGLKYIVTAHGSDVPGYNPDRFRGLHALSGPLWRRITSAAEFVVCPSATLAELVLAANPHVRVRIIPNGIDPDVFRPGRKVRGRTLVCTRMFPRKGVQYFLEALALARLPLDVHVVGDGPHLPVLRQRARSLGVSVEFHGALEHGSDVLKELYATSEVFVLTSEAENFPVALLEAMSAGCAIVTTRGTGCEEVVGEAALLVPPRDAPALAAALEQLTRDPALAGALSCAARARLVGRFSWMSVAEQYRRLYDEVQAR
jgi:glycosyltransferase involved in cell wall biosynthesis